MYNINHTISVKEKRKKRVRSRLHGTEMRPRVSVLRSNKHIFLQAIDDDRQVTVASVHDKSIALKKKLTKSEKADRAARELAKKLEKMKITKVVFDRGSYRYHGRVKIVADALRDAGMEV